MREVGFVAYIDESGDDGISRVAPIDEKGASEWFVLSALLVRASTNRELAWVRAIISDLGLHQRRELHFQPLDHQRRLRVCKALAELPVRCFTVMSNKRNMRRYRNPRAETVYAPTRSWFYWWMSRLLLERVTDYCYRKSMREQGHPLAVRLEFARRGGLRYSHFQAYLRWLKMQSRGGALFLKQGDLSWDVVNFDEIASHSPADRAGLQLSDVVASAFYQAVAGQRDPSYAMALGPRIAAKNGIQLDYGLKVMPTRYLWLAPEEDKRLFDFYSAMERQAPGP